MLEVLLSRQTILDRLTTDTLRPGELADEFEHSRSTIDRALSELRMAGLIERVDGHYRTTVAGTLALEEFERLTDHLSTARDVSTLLELLPTDVTVDPRFLDGCDVVIASPDEREGTSWRTLGTTSNVEQIEPAHVFETVFATGDHHRGVAPAIDPALVRSYRDAIRDGLSVAVALPHTAVEALLANWQQQTAEALETGQLTIRETRTPPPYALLVAESVDGDHGLTDEYTDAVAVLAVCADDRVCGFIANNTPAALEWARATLDEVWANARPLCSPVED